MGQKFHRNALTHNVYEISTFLCFTQNDLGENPPVDCENTLRVKNFVKIALARTVSKKKCVFSIKCHLVNH